MLGRLARGLTGLLPGRRARRSDSERAGWLEQAKARLDAGGFADAAVLFERILSIAPDDIEALKGRAGLHRYAGEFEEALALADEILAQAPDDIDAWCIRAFSERGRGRLDAALQAFRRAVAIEARAGLIACVGGILFQQGEIVAALNEMDHAIAADPEADFIHSNRLFMLNHDTRMSADAVAREHFAWGRSVEARMAPWRRPHDNDRSPDRRLRIGYVSADFRTHSVAFFFAPVLAAHDRSQVEVFCYDNQAGPGDAFTRRLQGMANHWIRTAAMDDPALATRIRADAIDILVDMSGHTGGNRLPVFAMQPAPLAVTWFGYMNTTGLATIDYRITDYSLCPPGSEPRYSETIHRVHGMAAWSAAPDSPQPGPSPAAGRAGVRFGSFNNWAKVSDAVIAAWVRILSRCPAAELLVVAAGGDQAAAQVQVRSRFALHGLAGDRLHVQGTRPLAQFLKVVASVDIALDPFPYNGGTTTLHTLWMGVPVVSMAAQAEVGHVAFGLLAPVGLADLCAATPEDYVEVAVELAGNRPRLARLRGELRARLAASPVMNGGETAANLEKAYRAMWHNRLTVWHSHK